MIRLIEQRFQVHGLKLVEKARTDPGLAACLEAYWSWFDRSLAVVTRDELGIAALVDALNAYKAIAEPTFDARPNSAQEVLQPSILEEFMGHLFRPSPPDELVRYPERGYLSLVFHPANVASLAGLPEFTIRRKDHDFVIGATLRLSIGSQDGGDVRQETVVVPAVAIECKRYLERNMLDECAGTAARVKKATPYCLYLIVCEYLKMDDARPELSRIDEIYVLRRQRNSERLGDSFVANPIYPDLVLDLYDRVSTHLRRIWWDPQSAITTGKVFDY